MKRLGNNVYEKICDVENLRKAYRKAHRHKGWQHKVKAFDKDVEKHLNDLHRVLINNRYKTSHYHTKQIYEPKERTIYILPFYPDRIVQHAIMNVIEPLWDRLLIYDSYACRIGKGQHKASKRCMEFVKRNKFCLKCDISKFYPSVNHKILFKIIQRKIKDKRLLNILAEIIRSYPGETNVPIGNYLSQWFGNIYMNEVDTYVKHTLKIKDYIRYCDDFIFFDNDKTKLNKIAKIIIEFCEERLALTLSKCDLFPTTRGVDFLGYRHFPSGYLLIRKSTAKRMKKRFKELPYNLKHHKISRAKAVAQLASAKGWLKHSNAHNFSMYLQIDQLTKEVKAFEKI